MRFNNFAADRKAEAGALDRLPGVQTPERLENLIDESRFYSDTIILQMEDGLAALIGERPDAGTGLAWPADI